MSTLPLPNFRTIGDIHSAVMEASKRGIPVKLGEWTISRPEHAFYARRKNPKVRNKRKIETIKASSRERLVASILRAEKIPGWSQPPKRIWEE